MFKLFLFVSSFIALMIGGLIVLIGIGAITGCAGGLLVSCAGGAIALIGAWSVLSFLLPPPPQAPFAENDAINLINHNGKWS